MYQVSYKRYKPHEKYDKRIQAAVKEYLDNKPEFISNGTTVICMVKIKGLTYKRSYAVEGYLAVLRVDALNINWEEWICIKNDNNALCKTLLSNFIIEK